VLEINSHQQLSQMSLSRASTEVSKSSNKNHPVWTLLGPSKDVGSLTTMNLNSAPSLPPINSRDKTSTSLRLLLCDTQHTMEGFSSQITTLTKDLGDAKRQIEEASKIVEDGHIKVAEDVRLLRKYLSFPLWYVNVEYYFPTTQFRGCKSA
jgi:hypothetical protein